MSPRDGDLGAKCPQLWHFGGLKCLQIWGFGAKYPQLWKAQAGER